MSVIGNIGKDAEVKYHGTECVINFSVAHTDKWKDGAILKERTTWVSCSWWTEKSTVAQYMRKGTQVYVEGVPEAKVWKKRDGGDPQPFLNLRVYSLQLLSSSGRRDGDNSDNAPQASSKDTGGYVPYQAPSSGSQTDDLDLPF